MLNENGSPTVINCTFIGNLANNSGGGMYSNSGSPALSKSAIMPPWSETLSEEEVDALIGHLRKLCACIGKES